MTTTTAPENDLSPAERAALVQGAKGLAVWLGAKFARCLGRPAEREEWVSEALEWLAKASRRYDPARGTAFASYAGEVVRNGLQQRLTLELRRRRRVRPRPLAGALADRLCDPRPAPPELLERAELLALLPAAVLRLPERERLVITLRYWHGARLGEVGRRLGRTRERARQLQREALEMLREYLDP
jgi:RNA polymerase sigma factor (sigma-70 family)